MIATGTAAGPTLTQNLITFCRGLDSHHARATLPRMDQQQENTLNRAVKDALHRYTDERFATAKGLALQAVDRCGFDLTLDLLRALSPPVRTTAGDRAAPARDRRRLSKIQRNARILELMDKEPKINLYSHKARTKIESRLRKAGESVTKKREREIVSFLQTWRAMGAVQSVKLDILDENPDWIGKSRRPEISQSSRPPASRSSSPPSKSARSPP
jgi:hypothetical protein